MSQEEKQNEECTCLASDNGYFCEGCKNRLWNEAFRSGKLAGFEVLEKKILAMNKIAKESGFQTITCALINSLIEEEKKKL